MARASAMGRRQVVELGTWLASTASHSVTSMPASSAVSSSERPDSSRAFWIMWPKIWPQNWRRSSAKKGGEGLLGRYEAYLCTHILLKRRRRQPNSGQPGIGLPSEYVLSGVGNQRLHRSLCAADGPRHDG